MMPVPLQSPEKELRFTRAAQARGYWVLAAVLLAGAVTLLACGAYRGINPHLPHPAWAVVPAGVALLVVRLAVHLTRHAYLILTPLGIEVFPFFRPARGMQLIPWQEVAAAETDSALRVLTLHWNAAKTGGMHLSLAPIPADRRVLLAKAVLGRVSPGRGADDPA
jgi:hypothetical protein